MLYSYDKDVIRTNTQTASLFFFSLVVILGLHHHHDYFIQQTVKAYASELQSLFHFTLSITFSIVASMSTSASICKHRLSHLFFEHPRGIFTGIGWSSILRVRLFLARSMWLSHFRHFWSITVAKFGSLNS